MARRTYTRHGLNVAMARVKLRGLRAIDDRRTAAARAVLDWRLELLDDLGGEAAVTAAQLALVEIAVRTRLFVDHCDAVLLARQSLIVRGRRLLPLVEQRGRLADSLARLLGQLGLERRRPAVPSLEAYVRERYGRNGNSNETPASLQEPRADGHQDQDQATDADRLAGGRDGDEAAPGAATESNKPPHAETVPT